MTTSRQPLKRNPQRRMRVATLPPQARSRAALGLSAAAAEGRFALQTCAECGELQYPPRDACAKCLSVDLRWSDVDPAGTLLAETTIRTSTVPYFRERTPWRIGTVRLDAGPALICHLHRDCPTAGTVRVINRLDRSGRAVLIALPHIATTGLEDDPMMRELSSDPKRRRVLITDGRSEPALALAQALSAAGAATIFVGESESWRGNPLRAQLTAIAEVKMVPLDITDATSVAELAAEIGGKVDILINTARFLRPGGALTRTDALFARQELEINYLGLLRMAQAFGPAMRGRGADGNSNATAWVNILSVYALSNRPALGGFSASSAAALSLSQCLRAEMRSGGIRVMNVFTGPTEDEWHQPLPPPKVGASALAKAVVSALSDGLEDVFVGDVAQDFVARWRADPKVLELEMAGSDLDA